MTDLLQWDPKKRPASAQVVFDLHFKFSHSWEWKLMLFDQIFTSSQALRYSYFHVGQALGTPQQILEQGRPQPGLVPLQAPLQSQQLQQQPLLLKPVPPSQPPPPNQHCSPSRPLQQIQPSPVSAAAQAAAYQRHTELVREQQPKHILKQEQRDGTPQSHLPYIVDKSLQGKVRNSLTTSWTVGLQSANMLMLICSFSNRDRSLKIQISWAISWSLKEGGGVGATGLDTLRVKTGTTMKKLIWQP